MSTNTELDQLEILAEVDDLLERVDSWTTTESCWDRIRSCQAVLKRLAPRAEQLKIRLESPLVVATFGGTGTGKSSLVNALVGSEETATGRQRPTTTQPILIAHPQTALDPLGLPLDEIRVVRTESPQLRDVVLLDCPDPDTCEDVDAGGNLQRLQRLLPFCDVLLYTSTQQKYRSARVTAELGNAATGCRLIFVQTHADIDSDIRDDWRRQLEDDYSVPELYFVDSLRALDEIRAGHRPSGDFGRLIDVLQSQFGRSARFQVRRANLIDLVDSALQRCSERVDEGWPKIAELDGALAEQRQKLRDRLSHQLRDELMASRNLWERRLLGAVTEVWGFSPFSSVLRFYNGLGGLIASMTFFRARTSAQMALVGALQGARWFSARQKEWESESQLSRLATFGLDDTVVRESQLIIAGYVHSADVDSALIEDKSAESLRNAAIEVEDQFLGDATQRVEGIIEDLSRRHSGWLVRSWYESLFLIYVGYILWRVGENFFYETMFLDPPKPILTLDFYIPAGVFFLLWSGTLLMFFTRRLRRGLSQRIADLAQELAQSRLARGLFPDLEDGCRHLNRQKERLTTLSTQASSLRQRISGAPSLGAPNRTPGPAETRPATPTPSS